MAESSSPAAPTPSWCGFPTFTAKRAAFPASPPAGCDNQPVIGGWLPTIRGRTGRADVRRDAEAHRRRAEGGRDQGRGQRWCASFLRGDQNDRDHSVGLLRVLVV